jgi:hypothetical protein
MEWLEKGFSMVDVEDLNRYFRNADRTSEFIKSNSLKKRYFKEEQRVVVVANKFWRPVLVIFESGKSKNENGFW